MDTYRTRTTHTRWTERPKHDTDDSSMMVIMMMLMMITLELKKRNGSGYCVCD
jgi:hypothetical protein